jgi:adenosylhomocysteine nucleosidase
MSGGETGAVAIVTAIPEELDAILSRAADVRSDPYRFFRARIGSAEVVLTATGDGARRAGRGVAALCDVYRPKALLGMGVAGALSQDLSPGDILVARRVCNLAADAPSPDERLVGRALAVPGTREATLVTARGPVVTRGAKAALAAATGADGAMAVDMESAAWAREAADRRIPYAIVRAVSDGADEELPGYLSDCMDAEGSIRRPAVLFRALARPASISTLLRMRRRVRDCSQRLAAFLESFLAEGI